MTSPALCALPRRNVGIASKISASTKRTSYMLTWPNLSWPRRKGEATAGVQHRLYKHQLVQKSCCRLYAHRELEEYKEKQDDNQNGGDAGKISSRHVCFWMGQFVQCVINEDNSGIFISAPLWMYVGQVSKGHGRTVLTSGREEKSESESFLSCYCHCFFTDSVFALIIPACISNLLNLIYEGRKLAAWHDVLWTTVHTCLTTAIYCWHGNKRKSLRKHFSINLTFTCFRPSNLAFVKRISEFLKTGSCFFQDQRKLSMELRICLPVITPGSLFFFRVFIIHWNGSCWQLVQPVGEAPDLARIRITWWKRLFF